MRPRFEAFVQAVILYSVGMYLFELEWGSTLPEAHVFFLWSERLVAAFFTAEYLLRWAKSRSWAYPLTPAAVVDLLAVLPFYLAPVADGLIGLRLLRTLRLFRLLKLFRGAGALDRARASLASAAPAVVAAGLVVALSVLCSAVVVYEAERKAQPEAFDGFGDAVWWAVVTMTTVGYGDVYPKTTLGRAAATATIVFGIAAFGALLSVLQEALAATRGPADDPLRAELAEVKSRLGALEELLRRALEKDESA